MKSILHQFRRSDLEAAVVMSLLLLLLILI